MPGTALYNFTNVKLEAVMNPDLARTIAVKLKPSTTFARGTILGEITASPGVYGAYDHTANDGRQVAKCILAYDVTTDVNGNPTGITFPYPPWPDLSVPAYSSGYFSCADMANVAELAFALAQAGFARLIQGTATAGIFALGA
jgi:hypothetical protein